MSSLTAADIDQLEAVFDRQLDVGLHHGAQLAVYHEGELVVDIAGGETGPAGTETTSDTRHLLFSCTKPFVGAAVHQLIEEDELGYEDRLVDHWPEFADEDEPKAEITVHQVLCHTAGIPFGELDSQPWDWGDWDTVVAAMEDLETVFPPGTQPAYHAMNYGWLLGELLHRVTGESVRTVVADRVVDPLGMDDTAIGLGEDEETAATLAGFDDFDRCRDPGEGLGMPANQFADIFNDEAVQQAVVPASNGIGTARDMARFYACLANGGTLDGTELLTETTVEHATNTHAETESDGTIQRPMRYGLGVWTGGLASDMFGTISHERTFGHAGLGSSVGWGDPETELGFAYVTNGIREESYEHAARVRALADAVRLLVS